MHGVKSNAWISFNDPSSLQNHNKRRVLQKLHSEVVAFKYRRKEHFWPIERAYRGWQFECVVWWNNRIVGKTKKCLYLYGTMFMGNTQVVCAGVWSVDGQFPQAQNSKKWGCKRAPPPNLGPFGVSCPFLKKNQNFEFGASCPFLDFSKCFFSFIGV